MSAFSLDEALKNVDDEVAINQIVGSLEKSLKQQSKQTPATNLVLESRGDSVSLSSSEQSYGAIKNNIENWKYLANSLKWPCVYNDDDDECELVRVRKFPSFHLVCLQSSTFIIISFVSGRSADSGKFDVQQSHKRKMKTT